MWCRVTGKKNVKKKWSHLRFHLILIEPNTIWCWKIGNLSLNLTRITTCVWLNDFPGCKPLAIHGARRGCQKTAAWITSFGQLQVMSRRDILSHLVAGAWGVFFMYLASAWGSTIYVANSSMWFQTKCRMYFLEWEKQEGSENHETSAWRDGLQDLLNGVIATKTSCHLESLQKSTNRHHTAATTWVPTT